MTRSVRCSRLAAPLFALAVVAAVFAMAGPADAHAFLISTDPAQGARLAAGPAEIALEFSSPVAETGASISVRLDPAGSVLLVSVQRQSGGLVLRASLAEHPRGIYLVDWHVVAEDGHESDGEFVFGVGPVAGSLPAARTGSAGAAPVDVGANWLFFAGLAFALGGVVTGMMVDATVGNRSLMVRGGLLTALAGAAVGWIDALSRQRTGTPSRAALAFTVASVLLSVALLAATWLKARSSVLVLVLGAAGAWSAKGHPAISGGTLGWVVDFVHLGAGAAWVGSLSVLVVRVVWRGQDRADALPIARRYARLALPLVVVLAGAGAVSALRLLPSWHDLWTSGYGQLILVKTGLFAAALTLAVVGRRVLAQGRLTSLRRAIPVEAVAVAVVLIVTAILVNVAPPVPARAAADLLGPPPLAGPVDRDAGLAGILTVAVTAGDGQLQVEAIAPSGGVNGTRAHLEATFPDGRQSTLFARPCGPGCFTQRLDLPVGVTRLAVTASAPGWLGGVFQTGLPGPPPAERPGLLVALIAKMRTVPAITLTELVSSGPTSRPSPTTFAISGSQFLAQEPYAGGTASDVQPLSEASGLRLYIAGDRIWVTIWLDPQGRIARERVIDVGHDVERTFRYSGG